MIYKNMSPDQTDALIAFEKRMNGIPTRGDKVNCLFVDGQQEEVLFVGMTCYDEDFYIIVSRANHSVDDLVHYSRVNKTRAKEKQEDRDQDLLDVALGKKTAEQVNRDNSLVHGLMDKFKMIKK